MASVLTRASWPTDPDRYWTKVTHSARLPNSATLPPVRRRLFVGVLWALGCAGQSAESGEKTAPKADAKPAVPEQPEAEPAAPPPEPTEPPALTCDGLVCAGPRVTDGDAHVLGQHPQRDALSVEISVPGRKGWAQGLPCDLPSVEQLPWLRSLVVDSTCTGIESLAPLATLTELRSLSLMAIGRETHQTYETAPLAKLTKLETFISRNTRLDEPAVIAGAKGLRRLQLGGWTPSSRDTAKIDFIGNFPKLEELVLFGSKMTGAKALMALPNLQTVHFESLAVDSATLDGFASIPKWTSAKITWADIESLSFLATAAKLESLEITGCPDLTSLRGIEGATALRTVKITFSDGVVDVGPMRDLSIEELDLDNTSVVDIAPLSSLPLTKLNLEGTKVTNPSPLTKLEAEELWLHLPSSVPEKALDKLAKAHPSWTAFRR